MFIYGSKEYLLDLILIPFEKNEYLFYFLDYGFNSRVLFRLQLYQWMISKHRKTEKNKHIFRALALIRFILMNHAILKRRITYISDFLFKPTLGLE